MLFKSIDQKFEEIGFYKVKEDKYVIAVAGIGYVGLSNAIMLAQHNKVFAFDILKEKVDMINAKKSPIKDSEIEDYLCNKELDLIATTDAKLAFSNADFVIISTPTNYDEDKNYFDTSLVENTIKTILSFNKNTTIVIKSTIPIGYTQTVIEENNYNRILFCPEFLREGHALYDNLYPSRIIIGILNKSVELMKEANKFASLLYDGAEKDKIPIIYTGLQEAESIKLFSNTYLAMRIAFFNEIDTFAELKNLNTIEIIDGVGLDPRIGNTYNNPSFGYGGYCLPKDTKQLLANYKDVPEKMIFATIEANKVRKEFIANQVYKRVCETKKHNNVPIIGIYRLVIKNGADNFRQSSVQDIMNLLYKYGSEIIIYEPTILSSQFNGFEVKNDINTFINDCDIIVANRISDELKEVSEKVYTRDLFNRD
jgi:UDPglucose 6-dehydrogenase